MPERGKPYHGEDKSFYEGTGYSPTPESPSPKLARRKKVKPYSNKKNGTSLPISKREQKEKKEKGKERQT